MLKYLGVSRSGYRAFLKHKPSASEQRRNAVKSKIQEIYTASKQNYGAPKITIELQKDGECIAERTVGKYMCEMGIRAQWVKPWIATTVDSDFSKELRNVLNEQFNRKIIAWTLSESMEVSFVVDTLNKAKARRSTEMPLILHSDRGSQYVSHAYRKAAEKFQLSYSHKGYPYDNACIESFHSIIKREWLNRFKILNLEHAHTLVFEYIETFYNTVRIHSHCGYMSPDQFEKEYENVAHA